MATDLGTFDVDAGECLCDYSVQVRVTGVRRMRVRLWIGLAIVKLGVYVTGMRSCEVSIEKHSEPE